MKTGYMFLGWFTENNESITDESIVRISDNHILYAHWIEISSQVEIVFATKDMTREEIERVIKEYTEDYFEIVVIEGNSGADETQVIIKFADPERAEEFVRNVNTGSEWGKEGGLIKRVHFNSGNILGISILPTPYSLFICLY